MARSIRVAELALRVRAPDQTGRAAWLIEDALRTASLPGLPSGARVAVRRLDLGSLSLRAPSQAVAARLDALLLVLPRGAVHVRHGGAAAASVVWAEDAVVALAVLAARLVVGDPSDAWFWPRLLPGWRTPATAPTGLRQLLILAAGASPAGLGQARLLEASEAAGTLDGVLAAVEPGAIAAWAPPAATATKAAAPTLTAAMAAPPSALRRRWLMRWGGADPRSRWLTSATLVTRVPALAEVAALPVLVTLALQHWLAGPAANRERRMTTLADDSSPQPAGLATGATDDSDRLATAADIVEAEELAEIPPSARRGHRRIGSRAAQARARLAPTGPVRAPRAAAGRRLAPSPAKAPTSPGALTAWPWCGEPSACAGVVLLITLLQRLGMDELLTRHADLAGIDLARRVLVALARAAGTRPTDPALTWLATSPATADAVEPASFVAPDAWKRWAPAPRRDRETIVDRSGRVLLACWGGAPPALPPWLAEARTAGHRRRPDLIRSVRTVARRWLRSDPTSDDSDQGDVLTLRRLVRRQGLIQATATHLDVTFPLHEADIRVRRRGLDLDPGWVPWLGKVVTIHYDEQP